MGDAVFEGEFLRHHRLFLPGTGGEVDEVHREVDDQPVLTVETLDWEGGGSTVVLVITVGVLDGEVGVVGGGALFCRGVEGLGVVAHGADGVGFGRFARFGGDEAARERFAHLDAGQGLQLRREALRLVAEAGDAVVGVGDGGADAFDLLFRGDAGGEKALLAFELFGELPPLLALRVDVAAEIQQFEIGLGHLQGELFAKA